MKNNKGITLIALVVTIIVLLILAGISIAMLTGDNGILGNANNAKSNNAYYGAEEQMKLCYMAVRTEIAAQSVKNSSYDATLVAEATQTTPAINNPEALLKIVNKDLTINGSESQGQNGANMKDGWSASVTDGVITIKYSDPAISEGSINDTSSPKVPRYNGKIVGTITLQAQGATFTSDTVDPTL